MPPTPRAVMIFAAGFGRRMGALSADLPKPLITVGGRPLIDHALDLAAQVDPDRIVINLHYRGEMIRKHLARHGSVAFSAETDTVLDTGGGLKHALRMLGEGPVYTLNSDAVWSGPAPLVRLRDAWDDARMDALLLLIPAKAATGHVGAGDFMLSPDGRLLRGPGAVYSGAQIIRTDRVAARPERIFSLNTVWDDIAADRRLFGVIYPGRWCDVGHPAAIPLAEALLSGGKDV